MSFVDETLSSFPNSLDQFNFLYTLPASQKTNASRYMTLLQKTRTPEEEAEFVSLTITLNDYLLTVDRWNKFASCIYSLEKFFSQNVQGYLTTKQTEWEAILNKFSDKGTYNPTITYMKWNTCQYNGETFLSKIDNNLNHTPVGGDVDIYWQKIAQKGVPGEQGIQGLPGANLIPRGKFLLTDIYNTDDLAEDNGSQYRCLQDGVTGIPTSNKTYWDLFLAKGGSTIIGGLPYTVTLSEPTSNVEFVGVGKISAFNKNLDIPMVFVDGHYLRKDVEYSINANGISIDKIPTATSSEVTWSAGTIINFLIIKNIVETINFNDGQLIDDESITINKLSEGLQDSINNIENKDGSFKIKSAFYTVGTDTLSIVISDGVGETISSNTINTITKTTDTTFNITPVTASATYTIYLKNDGNFASSLDSPILNGSILIGTISINADKSVNTIVDKRPLISASGNKLINLSSSFDEHTNGINPHNVTKLQIGLENVDNVQQASKVEFNAHLADTVQHITAVERTTWNAKVDNTDYLRSPGYAVTAGSSTAYTITLNPAPSIYADGQQFTILPHVACGANPTFNVNGLGASTILNQDGSAISAGDILANKPVSLVRVGSNFFLRSGGGNFVKVDFNNCIIGDKNAVSKITNPTALSNARRDLAATAIGNYALFGGGYTGNSSGNTVDAYDASLTRTIPTVLSNARRGLAATTIGNYALFSGGSYLNTVDAYDTSLIRTTPTALSIGRDGLAATAIGNYALFGGG